MPFLGAEDDSKGRLTDASLLGVDEPLPVAPLGVFSRS